jgi:hypothetical protein
VNLPEDALALCTNEKGQSRALDRSPTSCGQAALRERLSAWRTPQLPVSNIRNINRTVILSKRSELNCLRIFPTSKKCTSFDFFGRKRARPTAQG